MSEELNGTSGLIVKVSPWKLYLQAWLQKLLSVIISAKVLITMLTIWLTKYLATHHHVINEVAEDKVVEVSIPYINGEQTKDILIAVVVAYLGARIAVPVIEAVGKALNGKNKEE